MTLKIFAGCNNKGESPVEADLVRRSSDQRAVGPHSRTLRLQVSDGHTILLSGVPFLFFPLEILYSYYSILTETPLLSSHDPMFQHRDLPHEGAPGRVERAGAVGEAAARGLRAGGQVSCHARDRDNTPITHNR